MYGPGANSRFRRQASDNLRRLAEVLASSPRVKVQLRLGYVFGEDGRYLGPSEYLYTLDIGVESLRLSGVEMDVHIKTHPKFMDEWVDILVRNLFSYDSLGFRFPFCVC